MTHLIIESEHDIEVNIIYLTELAKTGGYVKKIDLTFPSRLLCSVFMENLLENFSEEGVSKHCDLNLNLFVPGGDEDNE